jgi:hypothetical protein
VSEL